MMTCLFQPLVVKEMFADGQATERYLVTDGRLPRLIEGRLTNDSNIFVLELKAALRNLFRIRNVNVQTNNLFNS